MLSASYPIGDQRSHVVPSLNSRLCHTGQRFAILHDACGVPNHKNVGMTRNGEVALHLDASSTITLRPEPLASRRGRHTGQPEGIVRLDVLFPDLHPVRV